MNWVRPIVQYSTRVLAQQQPTSLTVGDLVANFQARSNAATRLRYAKVLHREVPLRLARRMVGLADCLPDAIACQPSFRTVSLSLSSLLLLVLFGLFIYVL